MIAALSSLKSWTSSSGHAPDELVQVGGHGVRPEAAAADGQVGRRLAVQPAQPADRAGVEPLDVPARGAEEVRQLVPGRLPGGDEVR